MAAALDEAAFLFWLAGAAKADKARVRNVRNIAFENISKRRRKDRSYNEQECARKTGEKRL